MNVTLSELAQKLNGTVLGDMTIPISQLSPIDNIIPGALVFAEGKDNLYLAEQSEAAAVLVNRQTSSASKTLLQVDNPLKAFIELIHLFYPAPRLQASIHSSAVIDKTAVIGKDVVIGPFVVVGAGSVIGDRSILKSHVHVGQSVKIGTDTVIHPQVTIYDHSVVGNRVSIHASTVIGSDGFGYTFTDGEHLKIPHVGNVIIEDDVEIGANSVVDRATLGSTVVGKGSKIDNLVQVAHSVKLGKNNILCAFTGIAGSTISGNNVIFAANVGVSDHVRIDDGVILAARAGVPPRKHLKQGNIYLGNPARPKDKAIEQELSVTRIPIMRKNLKALSEKVNALDERLNQYENNDE
ncbi:UDP-3-O-(3-hydroxymyristoyl)glucosamine N-acyltransferase [Legionella genomosp. 1]|uniref:UDP-3-O-(3-hydroxymyristoyl)glucosamine N-acyltransferase n=1 Tax=Legionella genomosp. 1 TaxID=1093625 RepID=UPI00105489D2|nr:UDP-3-O-(3-hydroxymyristoyl)glucosamine N-acyltransferase [Legionella genomosp. 1]